MCILIFIFIEYYDRFGLVFFEFGLCFKCITRYLIYKTINFDENTILPVSMVKMKIVKSHFSILISKGITARWIIQKKIINFLDTSWEIFLPFIPKTSIWVPPTLWSWNWATFRISKIYWCIANNKILHFASLSNCTCNLC